MSYTPCPPEPNIADEIDELYKIHAISNESLKLWLDSVVDDLNQNPNLQLEISKNIKNWIIENKPLVKYQLFDINIYIIARPREI